MVIDLLIYFILWFFGTACTFGIWIPAGIFVPGMLMGCSLGLLYLDFMLDGLKLSLLRVGG
jgi:H+/Cl- antiporter ClcA